MKNRRKRTKNTDFYVYIFLIPLIIALIVLAQVVISGVNGGTVTSDGLMLEIVGIAISVWVAQIFNNRSGTALFKHGFHRSES